MKKIIDYITEHMFSGKKVSVKEQTFNNVVDLDLPSGAKWATCNIGADKPEDAGLLFQWGRTDGYEYDDSNCKFLTEYTYKTTSGKKYKSRETLKQEDDAAYNLTNGKLRMPTRSEYDELVKFTDNFWTTLNGIHGRKFVSKKDDSKWIFLPAGGFYYQYNFEKIDKDCYYWSSYLKSKDARFPYAHVGDSTDCYNDNYVCVCAMNIRGVLNK